jgi:hypothetical protein
MLEFKKLEIEDKKDFESYMSGHGYRHSEASFSNLFIWQEAWNIQWAQDGAALYMSMDSDIYRPFLLPPYIKDRNASCLPYMKKARDYMMDTFGTFYMKCVIPEIMKKIQEDCGDMFCFTYDPCNSEYMYNTVDLVKLEGRKYHSKRNHINKFLKNHSYEFLDYTPELKKDCLFIHHSWMRERGECSEREAAEELLATQKALEFFDRLNFVGCVVRSDGEPAAFSFGERISEDTAIIHIEKACCGQDGVYQLINREFAARKFSDTRYINRAEDMGMEGLRRAKLSYYPAFMLKRYDCELGDQNGNPQT